MIKILLLVTSLMGAGYDCVFTPELIVCTNDKTMEWTVFKKEEDGKIIIGEGDTT